MRKKYDSLLSHAAILVLGFAIGVLTLGSISYVVNRIENENISRQSYARGMYDSCMVISVFIFGQPVTSAMTDCMSSVAKAMASGNYYETPSPGFEWPLKQSASNKEQ